MKNLTDFSNKIEFLLTDIDDTLTDEGLLGPEAYAALWSLHNSGIKVIPVTGRPAGWCEMIARQWPVAGVVGENGGFYFRYEHKTMKRYYHFNQATQLSHRKSLETIKAEVLSTVKGSAIASDQFCRQMDLAVDFCEDVPALPNDSINKIVEIFKKHGAQAKVSSIHVNGWFGDYNKLSMTLEMFKREFSISPEQAKKLCGFSGDSPNDEPMFDFFPNSFAVANFAKFADKVSSKPTYIASQKGGLGFAQIAKQILKNLTNWMLSIYFLLEFTFINAAKGLLNGWPAGFLKS
jgi:HAD superfamily hydrolase (TIGR01484 family)